MAAEKRMTHPFQVAEYYSDGEILGSGQFATVYLARHIDTNKLYAIKEMDLVKIAKNPKSQQHLLQEINVMKEIHHPNVVTLYLSQRIGNFVEIVMDYCNAKDFRTYLDVHKSLSEESTLYFMRQFANGLHHLRERSIVHRDLKPQNLLLAEDDKGVLTLKIADFGFAKFADSNNPLETYCGTPLYMAPEVLQHGKYSDKADLWSVGVIMYEMLAGRRPWEARNIQELMYNIQQPWSIPATMQRTLSPECLDLLAGLLEYNEAKRISWENFFNHPWLLGQKLPSSIAEVKPTSIESPSCTRTSQESTNTYDLEAAEENLKIYLILERAGDQKRAKGCTMEAIALYQRVLTGLRKVKSMCPDHCKEKDLAEEHFVAVYNKLDEVIESAPAGEKMVVSDPDEVVFSYALELGQSGNSLDSDSIETAVSMFSSGVSVLKELVRECQDPNSKAKYQLFLEKFIERLEIANTKLTASR